MSLHPDTPPAATTVTRATAAAYSHSQTLTLDYRRRRRAGSGASVQPTLDGSATSAGTAWQRRRRHHCSPVGLGQQHLPGWWPRTNIGNAGHRA